MERGIRLKAASFYFVSVLVHVLILSVGLWFSPTKSEETTIPLVDLEDVPMELMTDRDAQFAESEVAPGTKVPQEKSFYGKRNQVVEEQTRAARNGRFTDGRASGPGGSTPGETSGLSLRDLGLGAQEGANRLGAATDDLLEGVKVGQRTLLTTREFQHFGFYERVKDQLRTYWKPEVEERALFLMARGKRIGAHNLVTRKSIVLDAEGRVKSVITSRSSGIPEIDGAATKAFELAQRFPNPPAGMVGKDGMVHLEWEFILEAHGLPSVKLANSERQDDLTRRVD